MVDENTKFVTKEDSPLSISRNIPFHEGPKTLCMNMPVLRQVGWLCHTGAIYALSDPPYGRSDAFSPLYIQVGVWQRDEEGNWYVKD